MLQSNEYSSFPPIYKPSLSRFYILFTFAFYSFIGGFLWNAWQPIMQSLGIIFYWTLTQINFLTNISSIVYCLFTFPFVALMNKTGFKTCYVFSVLFMLIGCTIRLFPGSVDLLAYLILVGAFITGLGGLLTTIGPPIVSMIWFPGVERTRATAVIFAVNSLGSGLAPIIASQIVPDFVNDTKVNGTKPEVVLNGLKDYIFLQCAFVFLLMVFTLIYFPDKPKIPPARSSENLLRIHFCQGFRCLLRNKQFWIVFILNCITYGVNSGVTAVFTSVLLPLGLTQAQSGLMNSMTSFVAFFAMIFGGWLGDRFSYKSIVVYTVFPTVVAYCVLGLQTLDFIPHPLYSLYIVIIILAFVSNIVCPISFEMGCEVAFPVREEVITAVLAFASNLGTMIYLFIAMIPKIGTVWVSFSYAGLVLLILPLMYFYKEVRIRLEIDLEDDAFINSDTQSLLNNKENSIQDIQ